MATQTRSKSGAIWRTDWFFGLLIVIASLFLYKATDLIDNMERRFYDVASTSTSRQPSDRIAVIAIDDQSIANLGRWPWSRDIHAKMIDQLAAAKAKTIVHTTFFFEPQVDSGLAHIRKIKQALIDASAAGAVSDPVATLITDAEHALDTDGQLAKSIQNAGNVLLPAFFLPGVQHGKPDRPLPEFVLANAMDGSNGFSIPTNSAQLPIDALGRAAAGVGHLTPEQDADGTIRSEPLLANYFGKNIPSLALLAAAKSLNLSASDIRINAPESVQLGKLLIKTDEQAIMRTQFYKARDGRKAYSEDSFYDVYTGRIPVSKYKDKIVIIGSTAAAGVGALFQVPGNPLLSPVEIMAQTTSSILSEHFIVRPIWAVPTELAALLLVLLYIVMALPRLKAGMAAAATAALLVALLAIEFGLLSASATWIQLVLPATALVLSHLGLTTKRFLMTEAGKVKSDEESAETNRMMGLALQGQGQLDMAFDRFRRVPLNDAVMGNLYSLALDFERKRQFNKAESVYQHMIAFDKGYKDIQTKLNRAKNLSETVMLGSGGHAGGTMLLDGGAVEKPMLGRYQVEKELGKGAMGVVYLGKDPKIGRVVAIKTMALSQEFAGDDLVDARERFFREAETAGRLQHQNIVTIFDAGEEHDLAYIAMEFLKGKDLADHCKQDQLLPVPLVLSVVARVAEALSYAHRQHVVHRDIKPANIMYEAASDTVKVTDFGIARITDSSKTKTGLVLGTPSFMSPEQLAGKKVDGRSDLYSLGVMLFQLLSGVLPFRGDSMSELMYKIANAEAPDIRIIRPELSQGVADIVALSLSKRPETRYQTGDDFAADLRKEILEFDVPALSTSRSDAYQSPPVRGADRTMAIYAPAEAEAKAQVRPSEDFLKTQPGRNTHFDTTIVQSPSTIGHGSLGGTVNSETK